MGHSSSIHWCDESDFESSISLGRSFRNNMILEQMNKDVLRYYDVKGVIGTGSISTIRSISKKSPNEMICFGGILNRLRLFRKMDAFSNVEAVQRHSMKDKNQLFALKTIDLRRVREKHIDEILNEVEILRGLDHPNIVKAFEIYEYKRKISVVMELCSGGDLLSRMPYNEAEACRITRKILLAISYMHKKNVIHRDLKMENVMFESHHPDAEIKVIDFGLSKKYLSQQYVSKELVGTLYTMAPEVLKGFYSSENDIWSIGVIAYVLLSNSYPFWGQHSKVIDKIMKCDYTLNKDNWSHISYHGKDFIQTLLKLDPEERPTAEQALCSPWIKFEHSLSNSKTSNHIDDSVHECLNQFSHYNQFKKIVLIVIAYKSTGIEVDKMRHAFEVFDSKRNGHITFSEFKQTLTRFHHSDEDLLAMFHNVDVTQNGTIDYTEFLAATLETQGRIEEERLAEAFDRFDHDCTGFISKRNMKSILGKKYSDELIESLIKEVDLDNDGQISYDDFLISFRSQKNEEVRKMRRSFPEKEKSLVMDLDTVGEDWYLSGMV